MMRKWGRRGTNSSVFLFNPLFIIIPLGKSSLFRKEERGGGEGGQRRSNKGNKVQESDVCSP